MFCVVANAVEIACDTDIVVDVCVYEVDITPHTIVCGVDCVRYRFSCCVGVCLCVCFCVCICVYAVDLVRYRYRAV